MNKINRSICFYGLASLMLLIAACETSTPETESQSALQLLREIPQSVVSPSVFRENILQERGIQPLDSSWYRPLGLSSIQEIEQSDNLYPLGRLPDSFGGQYCLLLLQDRPHRSRAWLIGYDDRGRYRDHILAFDLIQPKELKRWSYLQPKELEVYTTRDTMIYRLENEGPFKRAD